jgi:hypothetical protein
MTAQARQPLPGRSRPTVAADGKTILPATIVRPKASAAPPPPKKPTA